LIYHVTFGERTVVVELGSTGVTVDGTSVDVDFARVEGGPVRSLLVDGRSHGVAARRVGKERWDVHLGGRRLQADVVDERTRVIREMTGSGGASLGPRPVVAPMPGMVVRIEVAEGDTVQAGQGVVIVEAMKMENELKVESDGVVARVHVSEGQTVEKDQLLIDLDAVEEEVSV
jgi:biotin carboxyl carrier protein